MRRIGVEGGVVDMANRKLLVLTAVFLAAVAVCWLMTGRRGASEDGAQTRKTGSAQGPVAGTVRAGKPGKGAVRGTGADAARGKPVKQAAAGETADAENTAPAQDEETGSDSAEDEGEKLVNAFDALTDKWMEPAKDKISFDEIQRFVDHFRRLPKERKDECLHRALNLVPDENVMLLAGILMDKSLDKEYLELVYNDVLNRDEDVKKPILKQLFKDREHPCWVDTAWILDVTGELPKNGGKSDAAR